MLHQRQDDIRLLKLENKWIVVISVITTVITTVTASMPTVTCCAGQTMLHRRQDDMRLLKLEVIVLTTVTSTITTTVTAVITVLITRVKRCIGCSCRSDHAAPAAG